MNNPLAISLVANCILLGSLILSIVLFLRVFDQLRVDFQRATQYSEIAKSDVELERDQNRKLQAKVEELQDQICRINTITIEDEAG